MDFKVQAKLLQVLQDREFHRLGSKELCRVDVRIMAATHCDLEAAITEKRFREDLFYRLNIIGITIPPLRQRKNEILQLAECFIKKYGAGSHSDEVPPALQEVLLDHFWPGNVRELENLIRKYLVFRNIDLIKEEIRRKDRRRPENRRPLEHRRSGDIVPYKASTSSRDENSLAMSSEVITIRTALESFQWNHEQAARSLRMDYGTLLSRMKALAIQHESSSAVQGLPTPAQTVPPSSSILMHVDHARMEAEKEAIVAALSSTLWNRKQAATLLGIDYKALLYKMKKLGIGEKADAAAAANV
jgi:two-component system, NtrC family, response regulator AtoC